MDKWKTEMGKVREEKREERGEKKKEHRRESQKKEDLGAWKGRKVAKHCVFDWLVALEGRKVGSLKRVQSQLAREEIKNCTLTAVARSTFPSQNVQSTARSDYFWKLRCRNDARHFGAKQIPKSKCTKHSILRPLLEVEMTKKCTPLWREVHFQVKSVKHRRVQSTFLAFRCRFAWQAQGM